MSKRQPQCSKPTDGHCSRPTLEARQLDALRNSIFDDGSAGTRCLLDRPLVAEAARFLLPQLVASGHATEDAVATAFAEGWT
jgi:hypothetical protein